MSFEDPKPYIEKPTEEDILELCATANSFFEVEKHADLLKLDSSVIAQIQSFDPNLVAVRKDKNKLIAWSVILPTKNDIARQFLDGTITEKEMFNRVMAEKSFETLYYLSFYADEENRGKGAGVYLVGNQTKQLKNDHPEVKNLIATTWGEDGKRTLEALSKRYGLKVDFVDYKHE